MMSVEEGTDMKPRFLVFETSQMVKSFNWGSGNQKQVKLTMSMRHPMGGHKMAGINILDSGQNSLLSLF